MSRTIIACRDMVWSQMERQSSLNLECWSSDTLRVNAEATLSSEVFMLSKLRDLALVPHVESVTVKADSSYDRSSDEVYYSATAKVEVRTPDGGVMDISWAEELDALEDEINSMDEEADPEAVAQYRLALQQLKDFWGPVVDCGELNLRDFWKSHDEIEVIREEVEQHTDDGEVDLVGLADTVFGRKRDPIPLDRPPARWTAFELYRIDRRLKAGMAPQAMDEGGQTPLNAAVWYGLGGAVRALLRAGADTNAVDISGVAPLATAVHKNRPELIDLLLEAGADIDGPLQSRTALFALNADRGLPIEELLQRGLNLDVPMPDGGRLSDAPERYAPRAQDARLLRAHLTTGAVESAMAGGERPGPSRKRDFTL